MCWLSVMQPKKRAWESLFEVYGSRTVFHFALGMEIAFSERISSRSLSVERQPPGTEETR